MIPTLIRVLLACLLLISCGSDPSAERTDSVAIENTEAQTVADQPSILLITLDTTRADALESAETPNFAALRARGRVFDQAYTTAPTTLPAHASIFTGLLPIDHGIHENARYLSDAHPLLAETLKASGYTTAAFISGYPLASTFGLNRGFDHYDDDLGMAPERRAEATTDLALAWLEQQPPNRPVFLWVHYFDPHEPYDPPEPFRSRYPSQPYFGEIAYLDSEFGRLLSRMKDIWTQRPSKILVVGDHGEGLGEHGEELHGHLLYQATMRVPLIAAGEGIEPGTVEHPVSVRQVFGTLQRWANVESSQQAGSLLDSPPVDPIVLGEAMKPYLQYGWQPQVMAVDGRLKMIRSGTSELYDVLADPHESRNLADEQQISRTAQEAVRDYLERILEPRSPAQEPKLGLEERERLASLGYVSWSGAPAPLRKDAPSAKEMTHLFSALDAGSGAFVRQEYVKAVEIFGGIAEQDPGNLMVTLRLAVAHSVLGHSEKALEIFEKARQIAPQSVDVRHYLAMHLLKQGEWDDAAALFESVLAVEPRRLPALRSLAQIRQRDQDLPQAIELLESVVELQPNSAEDWLLLGEMRMSLGQTDAAIRAFEQARDLPTKSFDHFLELGVLYLASQDFVQARDHLDQVRPDHPGHAMALFKRAQVSVLLGEPESRLRIQDAYAAGDDNLRELIERESLFRGQNWQ